MRKAVFILSFVIVLFLMAIPSVYACSTCGCTVCQLGKGDSQASDQKWYARFLYDQLVWREKSAERQNNLINDDHDVHDKTTDITYHYELGRHITDDFNLMIDVPYMVRSAVEIEDVDNLGAKQRSKGLGDMQLLGDYRFWHNDHNGIGLAGGVKFPTGDTHRKNLEEERFETDQQPGSGAYNYIVGGIYKFQAGRFSATANASRVFTVKGSQGFEYGDLFTASLCGDYLINPNSKHFKTSLGIDTVFQDEWKEKTNGAKNPDSGGQTVLMGPSIRIDANKSLSILGTFLYPVSQRLNGFTQEQGFEWTLGTVMKF